MTPATAAALAAAAIVLATGALWFRRAFAVRLPADRTPFVVAMGVGVGLAAWSLAAGSGWMAGLLAGASSLVGLVFIALVAISAQKGSPGAFAVGEPLPDFTAPDDAGTPFAVGSLAGQPVLLKFFRGHW